MTAKKSFEDICPVSWKAAWSSGLFIFLFAAGAVLLIAVLASYPIFFGFIQNRPGVVLHDWVLAALPSKDVSGAIFFLIVITTLTGLYRSLQSPYLFLVFLLGYLFLNLSRLVTITLVPLEPPIGLTSLRDPIAFPFYGQQGITKDLFYSGHTGTLFLIYLVVKKRWEKILTLISTILIGILLLIQHIHYTIDVVSAPLFVYGLCLLAKNIAVASCPHRLIKTAT